MKTSAPEVRDPRNADYGEGPRRPDCVHWCRVHFDDGSVSICQTGPLEVGCGSPLMTTDPDRDVVLCWGIHEEQTLDQAEQFARRILGLVALARAGAKPATTAAGCPEWCQDKDGHAGDQGAMHHRTVTLPLSLLRRPAWVPGVDGIMYAPRPDIALTVELLQGEPYSDSQPEISLWLGEYIGEYVEESIDMTPDETRQLMATLADLLKRAEAGR